MKSRHQHGLAFDTPDGHFPVPSVEDIHAAIDRLPTEWSPLDGRKFVSWGALSRTLFPKGSPWWRRPQGQPHGLDRSPAWEFMNRLECNQVPSIECRRVSGTSYFARRKGH